MVIAQSTLTYRSDNIKCLGDKIETLRNKGEVVTYDIVNMYAGWEELLSLV